MPMTAPEERDPVEWLATEFLDRQRNGESPSVTEYVQKYPEHAEEIRDLFPTILAMERCKEQRDSQPAAPADSTLPEWIGDYRILSEIGRGGMGVVYEAEQVSLGRRVALKVLPRHAMLGEKALLRFRREARMAARLHHTNIVPVFGVGEHEGLHFYVMQLIRGVSLDKVIQALRRQLREGMPRTSAGPLPFSAERAAQALLGGSFAHSRPATTLAASGDLDAVAKAAAVTPAGASGGGGLPPPEAVPTVLLPAEADPSGSRQEPGSAPGERSGEGPGRPLGSRPDDRYFKSVARIGVQVADALHHAHLQGTVHRDVKPGNLLLDERGVIWLADFGLARDWDQEGLTRTGDIAGTLLYVAPEQLEGKPGSASDIYSLGATLYELLTLRPAFTDTQAAQMIRKIQEGVFPRPRALCREIPRDLETIILKAMARDPRQRYATAGELRDDLQRFLNDLPVRARRTSLPERFWRWCRRNRAVATLSLTAAGLLILALVAFAVGYFQTRWANRQVQASLAKEKRQRQRAVASSKLAQRALDRIFNRFAQDRLPDAKGLTIQEGENEIEILTPPVLSAEDAALLEQLLGYYEELAKQEVEDLSLRRKVADARRRVGDIRFRLGKPEGALAAYQGALELYGSLRHNAPGDQPLLVEVASIHNRIGNVRGSTRRRNDQRGAYRQALALLETVPEAERSDRLHFELAHTHYLLARTRLRRGVRGPGPRGFRRDAIDHRAEAIRILEDLRARGPSVPDYRFLLALCYREVPRDRSAFNPREVLAAADHAAAVLSELVKAHPGIPDYRHELVETYAILEVRPWFGRELLVEAEGRFHKALELSEPLVREHPNEPEFALSRSQVYVRLAEAQKRLGKREQAVENYRQALQILERLTQRFSEVGSYRARLAFTQDACAVVLMSLDQWKEARPLLEAVIARWEGAKGPERRMYRGFLGSRYRRLADVLDKLDDKEAATAARKKAEEYGRPFPRRPRRGGSSRESIPRRGRIGRP
jgi:serine/threonine protein kinase